MFSLLLQIKKLLGAFLAILKEDDAKALFALAIGMLISDMFAYHSIEKFSYMDSLYFSFVTLTTIGYGDFASNDTGQGFYDGLCHPWDRDSELIYRYGGKVLPNG